MFLIPPSCLAGPTAVVDQHFDVEQGRAVPDSPERTALIFPYKNQYVLFDGRLGHGVLGSSSKQPRMTMLINWWADKPQVRSLLSGQYLYDSYSQKGFKPYALPQPAVSVYASVHALNE